MRFSAVPLVVWMGIAASASAATYEAVFPPTTGTIDKGALASLTSARPIGQCQTPITTVVFSGGVMPGGVTVSGRLAFEVGPSFSIGEKHIVSWLAAIDGELTIGRGQTSKTWKVRQFNFLDQAARANWDRTTNQLSVFLPVVLTANAAAETHAFLVVMGTIETRHIVWKRVSFTNTEMVARAFPGSPSVEQFLGLSAPNPTTP